MRLLIFESDLVFVPLPNYASAIVPIAFGYGMNSASKYYCTTFVIFEFHSFDQQASVHFVSEAWVSLFFAAGAGTC